MRRAQITLAVGFLSEETGAWLREHGASMRAAGPTLLVTIPRDVDYADGPYHNTYTIELYNMPASEEGTYLYYRQDIDACESKLEVKGPADRL